MPQIVLSTFLVSDDVMMMFAILRWVCMMMEL